MRVLAVVLVGAAAISASASGAGGRTEMRCSQQSSGVFDGSFRDRRNLVVGPFAWAGARAGQVDGSFEDRYRWKQPALVRPGHTVILRIGNAARAFAGLTYDGRGAWDPRFTVQTVVFHGCPPGKAASRIGGTAVTFWAGGIVLTRAKACVPVEIRVDGGPVRRRSVPLGAGARCR
jgi:hypothetical protein